MLRTPPVYHPVICHAWDHAAIMPSACETGARVDVMAETNVGEAVVPLDLCQSDYYGSTPASKGYITSPAISNVINS